MGYFIKQIQNNKFNHFKYGYLDHMEGVVNMKDNYWNFAMDLYCADNSSLPLNSLTIDMQLPYQTVSNVQFNLDSDQSKAKQKVLYNIDYAKKYTANFNIDISQNQFLKQNLNNTKIDFSVQLQIDPEPIEKASFGPGQADLDGLITEYGEQRFNFYWFYTNTHIIDKSGEITNDYGYEIDSRHETVKKSQVINLTEDDLLSNRQSIVKLATLDSTFNFQVLAAKVKFNYWIGDDPEQKTLESDLNISTSLTQGVEIDFNKGTNYDFTNNKVILDPLGIKGFYIPKLSHGYFELEIKINQNENINTFIVKNNFVFDMIDVKPYIGCCQILIDYKDIEKFKEEFKEIKF